MAAIGLVVALASPPATAQTNAGESAQHRGAELLREGDLQGALREFSRAVEVSPESALAWYNRGLTHRALYDCRAAVSDFDRALRLQPVFFNALYQRGNCLQAVGEYARAVDDYSRAIAIPGRIDARFLAHFGRGDAQRRLGRLDEAHADYTRVSELRTDTAALRSRAWVSFYQGHWANAYRDASKYVHDTEAKEPDAGYAIILGALALKRMAATSDAASFLGQWETRIDAKRWPAPVISYLRGGDAGALLAAARQPGERTEAGAYLGVDLIARGAQERGVEVLKEVLRDGEPGYFEYDLAYHELRRLGLARPSDRRQRAR